MKNLKAFMGILLVFILGVAVGTLATTVHFKQTHLKTLRSPAKRTAFIVERLTKRLALNNEQQRAVNRIVQDMQHEIRTRFPAPHKEIKKVLDAGFNRIRALLTPAQQKKMDRTRREFEKRRKRFEKFTEN